MNYYIYENWQRESAKRPIIHKWDCGHCHMGFGKRVDAKKGANGVWIGPFDKVEYARAYYVMKFGDESNECNCVNH